MIERRPSDSSHPFLRLSALTAPLVAVLALVLPPAASADWIVTRDGARIETQGPWEEKGRLVVFTDADGVLRSLRASDVDREATARANDETAAEEPDESPSTEPREPRRSVVVLTDDDVTHVDPDELAEESEGGEGEEAGDAASANALVVSNWDQLSQPEGGLLVSGTLVNTASYLATRISVEVSVYDGEGTLVGQQSARLSDDSLTPSSSLTFRAIFPDLVGVANATFRVTNQGFDTPATRPEGAGASEGGDGPGGSAAEAPESAPPPAVQSTE